MGRMIRRTLADDLRRVTGDGEPVVRMRPGMVSATLQARAFRQRSEGGEKASQYYRRGLAVLDQNTMDTISDVSRRRLPR